MCVYNRYIHQLFTNCLNLVCVCVCVRQSRSNLRNTDDLSVSAVCVVVLTLWNRSLRCFSRQLFEKTSSPLPAIVSTE